jgi:hypothetical protein
MTSARGLALVVLALVCTGCQPTLRNPVKVDSPGGTVDLRHWDLAVRGPVLAQDWLWDPEVFWSPETGGRPPDLPPPLILGAPDTGGSLVRSMADAQVQGQGGRPVWATAHLRALVDNGLSYGLQIGALPGAMSVWVNGHLVWQTGVLSKDPQRYRSQGLGTVVAVQPEDGVLDIVAEVETSDPLVRHSELNRLWLVGPTDLMVANDRDEHVWRSVQVAFIALGGLVFLWLSRLKPQRRSLVYIALFLFVCLAKLVVNVEQPEAFLARLFPGITSSWYLLLNHALNLWPFPLFILFLVRQFPEDVRPSSFFASLVATAAATVWELLPFVLLILGAEPQYTVIMAAPWAFVLNVYVVLATTFIFEKIYSLFRKRRPLSRGLFYGGITVGVLILIPVVLSYFSPERYTFFLASGIFIFLLLLSSELILYQVRATREEVAALTALVAQKDTLGRYIGPGWALQLGRPSVDQIRPGDRRTSEVILVSIRSTVPLDQWLTEAGEVASCRQAVLVEWRDSVVWALDAWSETALSFAVELQRKVAAGDASPASVAVTRAVVEYKVLDAVCQWLPLVADLPVERLDQLHRLGTKFGAAVVLDASVQDGLVVVGWKRHRRLTLGSEIELYEGEEDSLATLKDKTLDTFEKALADARAGRFDEALQAMFPVVQANPFDLAARTHLSDWGRGRYDESR